MCLILLIIFILNIERFIVSNLLLPIAPLPIGVPEYVVYGKTSEYKFKLYINKTILGKLISSLSYLKVLWRNILLFSTQRNDSKITYEFVTFLVSSFYKVEICNNYKSRNKNNFGWF